ncbi:MAG: hypothetical protein J6X18_12450 [Bacteroidales bacterium]|nr:hypothetical protein [Bacteroidales bacterium]
MEDILFLDYDSRIVPEGEKFSRGELSKKLKESADKRFRNEFAKLCENGNYQNTESEYQKYLACKFCYLVGSRCNGTPEEQNNCQYVDFSKF